MTETDKKAVETFQQINYFCIAVFTIEIVLRLVSTPQVLSSPTHPISFNPHAPIGHKNADQRSLVV